MSWVSWGVCWVFDGSWTWPCQADRVELRVVSDLGYPGLTVC
jgi:hypothetical protein